MALPALSEVREHSLTDNRVHSHSLRMSALRLLSSAAKRASSARNLQRRGYAEVSDKIKLSLVLPHQVCHHRL